MLMVHSNPVFRNCDLPSCGRASEAMSGLKTSKKDADGDDDFASANGDNPEEDEELYQFLDAVSLFSWDPKSRLIAQKDSWNVWHALTLHQKEFGFKFSSSVPRGYVTCAVAIVLQALDQLG